MNGRTPEFKVQELFTSVNFTWSTDDFLSYWEDNEDRAPTPDDYYAWVKEKANKLECELRYALSSTDISLPSCLYFTTRSLPGQQQPWATTTLGNNNTHSQIANSK
jgi:hypothetical protein